MNRPWILALSILLTVEASSAGPSDSRSLHLKELRSAHAACEHWGGEDPGSDPERQKEIKEGFILDCTAAVKRARQVYQEDPENPEVSGIIIELIDYVQDSFGADQLRGDAAQVAKYCETSIPYFKGEFKETQQPNEYFHAQCPRQAAALR